MVKNIIFDWAGVIKDSVDNQLLIVNRILKDFSHEPISLAELKENWSQPHMLFFNKYLPELTASQQETSHRQALFDLPVAKPYPGIVEMIKRWKNDGIRMAVISSDLASTFYPEVENFGLDGCFVKLGPEISDKEGEAKKIMNEFSFKAGETAIIGDSNHEIEVGKNLGLTTIAVTWGFVSEKRLASCAPDLLVHNLEELNTFIDNQRSF